MNGIDKAIIKFLSFLQEYRTKGFNHFKEQLSSPLITTIDNQVKSLDQKIVIAKNFQEIFSTSKGEWSKHRILCKDFDILSDLLLQSPLNTRECTAIVFLLVEKNLIGKILDGSSIIIDYPMIENHHFRTLSKEELEDKVMIYHLLVGDLEKEDIGWSQEQYDEFYHFAMKQVVDISDVQKYHKDIKEHYFDRIDDYKQNDIEIVLEALLKLKVREELVTAIRYTLESKMNRRLSKGLENTFSVNTYHVRNECSDALLRLEETVDLKELMPRKFLSQEQTLEIVVLMLKAKINREQIQIFLKNLEIKNVMKKVNPVTQYLALYDKLKFYELRLVLVEELKSLEDYFQMLGIANDEEYSFWKKCLEEELTNYLKAIPGSFDYEFEEGKKRLKKEKNEKRN